MHFFRRLVIFLLALALFAPASAFGRVLYSCSMSGKVTRNGCCCHQRKQHAQQEQQEQRAATAGSERSPAQAQRRSCCEVQDHRVAPSSASSSSALQQVPAAALASLLPAFEARLRSSELVCPERAAARGPPTSLSARLRNCSLLL